MRLRTLLLLLTLILLAGTCLVGWFKGSTTWTSRSPRPAVSQHEFSHVIGSVTVRRVGWMLKLMHPWDCPRLSPPYPKFAVYQNGRKIGSGNFGYPSDGVYSCWWPVPFSVGDSELQVVVSGDGPEPIRELIPNIVSAAVFHWRWYYYFPAWPIWPILVSALILPKANRHRQAWLVLLPLGFVLLVWQMRLRLLVVSDDPTRTGYLITSIAVAWTLVWLLGHWLKTRYSSVTFLLLGLMLAIGALLRYCELDLENSNYMLGLFAWHSLSVLIILLSTMFNAHFCRKRCTLWRFLWWLAPWTCLVAFFVIPASVVAVVFTPPIAVNWKEALMVFSVIGGVMLAVVAYLLNLPFVLLAFKNPFYRKRFATIFGAEPIGVSDGKPEDPSA